MDSASAPSPLSPPFVSNGHDDTRSATIVTTLVVFWIATLLFLLQLALTLRKRFFLKTWPVQTALACAWAFATIQAACLLTAGQLKPADASTSVQRQLLLACDFISVWSIAATKVASIVSVMTLMFPRGTDLVLARVCIVSSALYLIVALVAAAIEEARCGQSCKSQASLRVAAAVVNIVSEILIIVLPIPVACKVNFPDAIKTKSRVAVISGYMTRLAVITLLCGYIASNLRSGDRLRLDNASTLWNQGVVFAALTAACIPTSMSFIKLARSGAMGARMHSNRLESVVVVPASKGSAGTDSSGGKFTRKIRNMKKVEGTRSTCRSEPPVSPDSDRRMTGLSQDGIHVVQELTIEPECSEQVEKPGPDVERRARLSPFPRI